MKMNIDSMCINMTASPRGGVAEFFFPGPRFASSQAAGNKAPQDRTILARKFITNLTIQTMKREERSVQSASAACVLFF